MYQFMPVGAERFEQKLSHPDHIGEALRKSFDAFYIPILLRPEYPPLVVDNRVRTEYPLNTSALNILL